MSTRWIAAALLVLIVGSGAAVWRAETAARGRPAPDPRYQQMNEIEILRAERRDLELFLPAADRREGETVAMEEYDAGLVR